MEGLKNKGRPPEFDYTKWLVDSVNIIEGKDYGMMLRELYRQEFYSIVRYDEDRGSDGVALRETWMGEVGRDCDLNFGPCKILEMLIGISFRIEFQLFGSRWMEEWDHKKVFWQLIENLGLDRFEGRLTEADYEAVVRICDAFCARKYKCDGFGNIFRIFEAPKDVRKLNLWAQMGLYIREKWPI